MDVFSLWLKEPPESFTHELFTQMAGQISDLNSPSASLESWILTLPPPQTQHTDIHQPCPVLMLLVFWIAEP